MGTAIGIAILVILFLLLVLFVFGLQTGWLMARHLERVRKDSEQ